MTKKRKNTGYTRRCRVCKDPLMKGEYAICNFCDTLGGRVE